MAADGAGVRYPFILLGRLLQQTHLSVTARGKGGASGSDPSSARASLPAGTEGV